MVLHRISGWHTSFHAAVVASALQYAQHVGRTPGNLRYLAIIKRGQPPPPRPCPTTRRTPFASAGSPFVAQLGLFKQLSIGPEQLLKPSVLTQLSQGLAIRTCRRMASLDESINGFPEKTKIGVSPYGDHLNFRFTSRQL
jgi:hypothetical protein